MYWQPGAGTAFGPYQGGIAERHDDVGVKVIQHGPLDGPDCCGVARQGRDCHLRDCQARPQQSQAASGASPTQGVNLWNLLVQQICYLEQTQGVNLWNLLIQQICYLEQDTRCKSVEPPRSTELLPGAGHKVKQ